MESFYIGYLFINYFALQHPETDPHVILFSLIALEKFAQTTESKSTVMKTLHAQQSSPIEALEPWVNEEHYVKRQVGFCAQWALDNLCKYYTMNMLD